MQILQQPDALSLSGNLKLLKLRSSEPVTVQLATGGTTVLEQRYEPNTDGDIAIDFRQVVSDSLSFNLSSAGTVYEQTGLAATFVATIGASSVTFTVVRGGVFKLQDSASNFLTQNFLTWQPTEKRVSYYTPEFLTYYATVDCTVKLKACFNADGNVTDETISLASLTAGKAYTIPLEYSLVAGLLQNRLPAWYDVWVENGSGTRLTYIQRYIADNARSREEDWILFENSLGGIDTLRAYGPLSLSFKHEHKEAAVGEESLEYDVDAERIYSKDTGKLSHEEAQWLVDFFPSTAKYIYLDSAIQRIVVTGSTVSGKPRTEPVSFKFTFKLADRACLLNRARMEVPASVLGIVVPDLGNFTLAPRLSEFPSQQLSGGILFPVQDPYSEGWGTASLDALVNYLGSFGWVNGSQLADALGDAIADLRAYMEQAFRTGIITQAQAMAIEKYINVITTTMRRAEKDYESLCGNSILQTTQDPVLLAAKDALDADYGVYVAAGSDLLDLINLVIRDNVISQEELDAINSSYEDYNDAYADFSSSLSSCQSLLIGSNAASLEALDQRFLRKANTKAADPEGDTETLPITFTVKQYFSAGFRSIAGFMPGVTGKGTDLTIVNTVDDDEITATADVFTTDFIVARRRLQTSIGWLQEAEFGTFIEGGSGYVGSFSSSDGLTPDGRGAKIFSDGSIEGGNIDSRGNIVARGVQYDDGTGAVILPDTGEVIGYSALQAGRTFVSGLAGSGIRFNSSGYGQLSSLAVRSDLVNAGVFADGFFGEGFKIWRDQGTWKMTIDQLTVRQIMNVYELLVNRIRAVGGMLVVSPASGKVKSVESDGDFWKLRFESGGDSFELHDLIRMQRFSGEDYVHGGEGDIVKGYWVEVLRSEFDTVTTHNDGVSIEQTEQTVWVSKTDIGLWSVPAPGDDVVQMGNTRNPARQSLIALTANESTVSDGEGGQQGTPTIEILTGVGTRNFSGTNRTRLGYVGDISDSAFYNIASGVVENPQGYGLYSDNAYLKGRFVLSDGTDVYTMFSIQSGLFESAIGNVSTSVMTDRENYLRDASFSSRFSYWGTNTEHTYFHQPLGRWIVANGGLLNYAPHDVSIGSSGGIRVATIKNGSLTQSNSRLSRTPDVMDVNRTVAVPMTVIKANTETSQNTSQENFKVDANGDVLYDTLVVMEDGTEVPLATYNASPGSYTPVLTTEYVYDNSGNIVKDHAATPIWLTFMIAVEEAGTLTIGFDNENASGFSAFSPFSVSERLDFTGTDSAGQPRFIEKSYLGYWSGTGDFRLSFTGKCSVYGLRLWSDMELQYNTKIRQTDEYIRLEAQARNAMGEAYKSMLEVTAKQIQSIVSSSDGRISSVKQTADGVSAEVADARGNAASLKLRIDGIESNVSTISGDVSSLQQTATSLTGYVGSFAAGATLANDIATAASDAQAAAISAAASDATSKANAAIQSAVQSAALDAKDKADAALGDAKDYVDGKGYATETFVTSGYVAQSNFATLYAAAVSDDSSIVKSADMGVYVTWDENTHQISTGAVINADQITFTGRSVTVKNTSNETTFGIDSSGNVSMAGTVNATGGYIGGLQINSGSIGSTSYSGFNIKSALKLDYNSLSVTGVGGSIGIHATADHKITVNNLTAGAAAIYATASAGRAIETSGEVYVGGNLKVTGSILDAAGNPFFVNTDTTYAEATSSVYGLIKIGYTQSGKNYPVQLASGKAYVNVPWSDTNTTYSNGNGISLNGTTFSLSNSFTVSGSITASDFILSSDARLKDIKRGIDLSVEKIASARIVNFTFLDGRDDGKLHGGVIAQDWQDVAPWALRKDSNGMLGVCYPELAMVSAVECAREIVKLKEMIRILEERMAG